MWGGGSRALNIVFCLTYWQNYSASWESPGSRDCLSHQTATSVDEGRLKNLHPCSCGEDDKRGLLFPFICVNG